LTNVTIDPVSDIIAAGVLITAVLGYLNVRQNRRQGVEQKEQGTKLSEVHDLVNSQLSDAIIRRDVSESENVQLRADADKSPAPE
jgi:hypothetical protein